MIDINRALYTVSRYEYSCNSVVKQKFIWEFFAAKTKLLS